MIWLLNVLLAMAMLLFPAPRTFVAIGDSITFNGWPQALAAEEPQITLLHNSGIGGNTTAMMLARFDADVLAYHPQIVAIMGGTNDIGTLGAAYSEVATIANLRAMVELAKPARVILMTIAPRNDPALLGKIQSLNAAIRQLAISENVRLVDVYPVLAGPDGLYAPGLTTDGIHPTGVGEGLVADAVRAAL